MADAGVNRAFGTWGQSLTGIQGKARPPNDADVSPNKLSYWTDNGATYYHHTEAIGPVVSLVQSANPDDESKAQRMTRIGLAADSVFEA